MILFLCFLVSLNFDWEDMCNTQVGVSPHFQTTHSSKIHVLHCMLYFQLSKIIVGKCSQTQSCAFDIYYCWNFQQIALPAFHFRLATSVKKGEERVRLHMVHVWTVTRQDVGMHSMSRGKRVSSCYLHSSYDNQCGMFCRILEKPWLWNLSNLPMMLVFAGSEDHQVP